MAAVRRNKRVKTGRNTPSRRPSAEGPAGPLFFSEFLLAARPFNGRKNAEKPRNIRLHRLSHGCCFSWLTSGGAEAYIPAIGAPFRKLRLDGAPLKLLTGSVKMPPMVFGSMSFDDAFKYLAAWQVGFSDPGLFEK